MHIGFDISKTGYGKAGCGYFAHAMIKAMLELAPENRYSLYPSFGDFYFDPNMPLSNPYEGRYVDYGARHDTRESARKFWLGNNLEASIGKPDVLHANNFWCPVNLASSRLIYTFYDMGCVVDPAWTTEANRVGCFDGVFRSAMAADWVVAISEASRAHYLNVFPHFPEDRIRVIYPCSRFADSTLEGERPNALNNILTGEFWLSVGTIEPRKNQRRLAEAYAHYLAQGGEPMPLVLAGGKGWLMEDFQKYLIELGISANIVMTGYVSDEELIWLYRNCYAHIYPSLFEGFGLPVLEGMQFGAPTLTSRSTSIPEVAGDAAILIAPEDTRGWAEAMLRLSLNSEERHHLSTVAREQASRFNWRHSAALLLQLYKEALASPKRVQPYKGLPMKVSIVTPSFNQGEFIERTLQSVTSQTGEEVEHVVFDGGSTDNTVEILKRFSPPVRWISKKDKGQADAVNQGIRATDGEIIGWLNSDDIYYPGVIARVVAFFKDYPEVDVVYGMADYIDREDHAIGSYPTEPWNLERLTGTCFICQPALFFRRRVVEKYGLLDEKLNYCMDYEYWMRLGKNGARFAYLEEKLAGSRMYAENKTMSATVKVHKEINDMFKKLWGRVPDTWLHNYAHLVMARRFAKDNNSTLRQISFLAYWIIFSLRWNRRVSADMFLILYSKVRTGLAKLLRFG